MIIFASVRIDGMKGPISEGELPKCKEFGAKSARQIIGDLSPKNCTSYNVRKWIKRNDSRLIGG
jgi:hypothetical protein